MCLNDWAKKLAGELRKSAKKKPYAWGFWAVCILLVVPLIISVCYWIGDNHFVWLNTSLTVGDALGFYGSFLTLVGTIVLGGVAIIQNNRSTRINTITMNDVLSAQLPAFRSECHISETGSYEICNSCWKIGDNLGADFCYEVQENSAGGYQVGFVIFGLQNISGFLIKQLGIISCRVHTIGKIDGFTLLPVFDTRYTLKNEERKSVSVKLISDNESFFHGIKKDLIQLTVHFNCLNAQRRWCKFYITILIHHGKCEVVNSEILTEYKEVPYQ